MVILTNLTPPTEGVHFQEGNIAAVVENRDLGLGTLVISESCVCWIGGDEQGFSLDYPTISLHAVSRDLANFPKEHLYLMIHAKSGAESGRESGVGALASSSNGAQQVEEAEDEEEEEDQDEENDNMSEIRFVPANKEKLDDMFSAMSNCQILHPDEEVEYSDDDWAAGDAGGVEGADEDVQAVGQDVLQDGVWCTSDNPDEVQLSAEGMANLRRIMANSQGLGADSNGDDGQGGGGGDEGNDEDLMDTQ